MAKKQQAGYAPRNPYEPSKPVDSDHNPRFSREGTRKDAPKKAAKGKKK